MDKKYSLKYCNVHCMPFPYYAKIHTGSLHIRMYVHVLVLVYIKVIIFQTENNSVTNWNSLPFFLRIFFGSFSPHSSLWCKATWKWSENVHAHRNTQTSQTSPWISTLASHKIYACTTHSLASCIELFHDERQQNHVCSTPYSTTIVWTPKITLSQLW